MSLIQLRSALEQHVGFQINSIAACRRLEQLLIKQGYYVSYTTLSRIFGLAKIKTHARSSTLDELVALLGYEDYSSFLEIQNQLASFRRLNLEHQLVIEALLGSGKERAAIDHLLSLHENYPTLYKLQSQTLALHFFGKEIPSTGGIDYLLSHKDLSYELFQFFVFEDDPYNHYQHALTKLIKHHQSSEDLLVFHNVFTMRKDILKGNKLLANPSIHQSAHYHLISRTFELELLQNKVPRKTIRSRTDEILHRITDWKEADFALAFVGRWCRGLIYTEQHLLLQDHIAWKEQCIALLQIQEINKEFQAVIYTFLALTYGYHGSLAFMYNGEWENAKLESKLLLSLAFKQHDAFKIYKRLLGYV